LAEVPLTLAAWTALRLTICSVRTSGSRMRSTELEQLALEDEAQQGQDAEHDQRPDPARAPRATPARSGRGGRS
jgi:hypothetical protein